jgi:hypothetical protein
MQQIDPCKAQSSKAMRVLRGGWQRRSDDLQAVALDPRLARQDRLPARYLFFF